MSLRKLMYITRYEPGHWVDGEWVEGGDTTLAIEASVQPATQEDMLDLPEGKRKRGTYKLFTETELRTVTEGGQSADRTTIRGEAYEISAIAPWENDILPHYKALATRIEP